MRLERYSRQILLSEIGEEGQALFSNARVLVVGLGGLGSPVCTYLVGAGVGTVGLCDRDAVSLSNLHRQTLYCPDEECLPKVKCAFQRLKSFSPGTDLPLYPDGITEVNALDIIEKYDIVVDCTDNFKTRYTIDDACTKLGKPWVHASIEAFYGYVVLLNGERGVRYRDIFPDREELFDKKANKGVFGPLPGIIGSIQASEVLKWVGGFGECLDGKLMSFDAKTLKSNIIEF